MILFFRPTKPSYYDSFKQALPPMRKTIEYAAIAAVGIAAIALLAHSYPVKLIATGSIIATKKMFTFTALNGLKSSMNQVNRLPLATITGLLAAAIAGIVSWSTFHVCKALSSYK